jgi:hypothetical protein
MARGDPVALEGWAMELARDRNMALVGPGQGFLRGDVAHDTREALLELARQAPKAAGLGAGEQWDLCMKLARKSAAGMMVALSDCQEKMVRYGVGELAMGMLEAVGRGKTLERDEGVELKLNLDGEDAERAKAVRSVLVDEFGPFEFGLGKRADSALVREFVKARDAALTREVGKQPVPK